jgi:DNA helicase-2/ATP-dependent DNA helicase PcrA
MSERAAAEALRSDAGLVVIEAPAGCGKTFQAAALTAERASNLRPGRMLILTHTHAACDVIAKRAPNPNDLEIRTIDSLLVQIGTIYHRAIDLPPDVSAWARQSDDGYREVAARIVALLTRTPHIAAALAKRYPIVLCDEHQDSNLHQHAVVMLLHDAGARLRIFGDPMQSIYSKNSEFVAAAQQWSKLCSDAEAFESLDVGHRWIKTAPELGEWIQEVRATLRDGGIIDLSGKLPKGLYVIRAENQAQGYGKYRLDKNERKPVDRFVAPNGTMLVLASQNKTVGALRGVFARGLPIWEGHTRSALDILVKDVLANTGNPIAVGRALVDLLGRVAVGFTPTGYGNRLIAEIEAGCTKRCRGKPAMLQGLAKILLAEPNHRGIAMVLRNLEQLMTREAQFSAIKIDYPREYREAIHLGDFADMSSAHSEMTRRRTALRPAPPLKAISTVHKAKGLECDRVLVLPCDKGHFADKAEHRCLLYVALSRPMRELALVIPTSDASTLFRV